MQTQPIREIGESLLPANSSHGTRGREEGHFLIEVLISVAVAVIAVLGALSVIPSTLALEQSAREHSLARAATERRVADLQAMNLPDFHATFASAGAGLPIPGVALLSFDVVGLDPAPGRAAEGVITMAPDPVTQPALFAAADTFTVTTEVVWRTTRGTEKELLVVKLAPEQPLPVGP